MPEHEPARLPTIITLTIALAVRGSATLLQFFLSVILGHMLGAAGVGLYYLYISWTHFLCTFGSVGLPTYVLRSTACNRSDRQNAFTANALQLVFLNTSVMACAIFLLGNPIERLLFRSSTTHAIITYSSLSAIALSLIKVSAESLKGYGKVNLALTLEFNGAHLIVFAILSLLWCFEHVLRVADVFLLHTAALAFVAVLSVRTSAIGSNLFSRHRSTHLRIKSLSGYWCISLSNIVMMVIPYLVLPYFCTPNEVGQFAVVHRLIGLSSTILVALASYFGPFFAKAYFSGDTATLTRTFRLSQWFSVMFYLPIFCVYVFAAPAVLSFFGPEFPTSTARMALIVMASGRMINALCGLTEYVLNMTGHESWEMRSAVMAVVLFLMLSFALGSSKGVLGISISFAVASGFRAVYSLLSIYKEKLFSHRKTAEPSLCQTL